MKKTESGDSVSDSFPMQRPCHGHEALLLESVKEFPQDSPETLRVLGHHEVARFELYEAGPGNL